MDFGAKCDGVTDDFIADSTAFAFAIAHPNLCSTITFPIGTSRITKPLWMHPGLDEYFTIHIKGMLPAKEASQHYLSQLYCDFKSGFGIGISGGRGVIIENLSIVGKYTPPKVTSANIGTLRWTDWNDRTIHDSRYAPYAGVCIDPYAGYPGTSGMEVRQCRIVNWVIGACLSPAGGVNDEMINFIDDDVESVKICYAICQDQSKEIHIVRPKMWAACHTFLDGLAYGVGDGGGSVDIDGGNFAGAMNELFNLNTDRFSLSVKDIYCESLFRIGTVGKWAGANCIDCQIDFLTQAGWPEPDFMLSGIMNFYGGMLRYYDNSLTSFEFCEHAGRFQRYDFE